MKKITLFLGLLISTTLAFSQENSCASIQSSGVITTPNPGSTGCLFKAYFYASGVSSRKNINIQVYVGSLSTTPVQDICIEIPRNSPSTVYETPLFSSPCNAVVFLVLTRYTASNGTCNGGICGKDTVDASGGALPIKMTSFFAKRNNSSIGLSWQTESEANAKEFIIQRKSGNDFIDVGTIAALNNATGSKYIYSDINNLKGISQYRLKMIDLNGTFKYSEIRTVKGTSMSSDFTVFPNPSTGNAKITITDISESTDVQLVDNSGRVLKNVSMNNSNTVDFNNLQKGMYMIRIINKNSGETLTKKLSVVN